MRIKWKTQSAEKSCVQTCTVRGAFKELQELHKQHFWLPGRKQRIRDMKSF